MGQVFLGRWWHWVVIVAVTGVLWFAGSRRMHVIEFNSFILGLLAGVGILIVMLLMGTRAGEQVTREPIRHDEDG